MHQFLIISELEHFLLTLGIALLLFWRYRNWRLIPVCFLFGLLVDVDHLIDHFICLGWNFDLSKFFGLEGVFRCQRAMVLFHGWEFVPLLWIGSRWLDRKFKIRGLEWATSLAYLGHLILDNFSFSHHPLAYFFFYRLLNNFSLASFNAF